MLQAFDYIPPEELTYLEAVEFLQDIMETNGIQEYCFVYRGVPVTVSIKSLPKDIETIYYLKRVR